MWCKRLSRRRIAAGCPVADRQMLLTHRFPTPRLDFVPYWSSGLCRCSTAKPGVVRNHCHPPHRHCLRRFPHSGQILRRVRCRRVQVFVLAAQRSTVPALPTTHKCCWHHSTIRSIGPSCWMQARCRFRLGINTVPPLPTAIALCGVELSNRVYAVALQKRIRPAPAIRPACTRCEGRHCALCLLQHKRARIGGGPMQRPLKSGSLWSLCVGAEFRLAPAPESRPAALFVKCCYTECRDWMVTEPLPLSTATVSVHFGAGKGGQ